MALPSLILDVDPAAPAVAAAEAERLHASGQTFSARIPFAHPRITFAMRNAAALLERGANDDERRSLLDALGEQKLQLAGKRQIEAEAPDQAIVSALRKIVRLAEGVVVGTWCQCHQLEYALGVMVEPLFEEPRADVAIPDVARDPDADAIVVWAPAYPAELVAIHAFALEEIRRPAFVVCQHGLVEGLRAEFVPYERAEEALRRAAVLVDATVEHPGNALAAARLGLPLAVSVCAGAHEIIDGVAVYLPWSRVDVLRSVQIALGLRPPRPRSKPETSPDETIVADPERASEELSRAVELRRSGKRFRARVNFPHEYAGHEHEVAADLAVMRDVGDLAERTVSRSWLEAFRLVGAFGQYPTNLTVHADPDPDVPPPVPREPDGTVVVWAPRMKRDEFADVSRVIERTEKQVASVCRDTDRETAANALRRASIVVAVDPDDPGPALGLAKWGIPLCVTTTSGANEYLERVERFHVGQPRSIADAVSRAERGSLPVPRSEGPFRAFDASLARRARSDPDLVSLVVRSRAGVYRERVLESIAQQTYPRVETIWADDNVKDVNRALKASQGAFIGVLDERDLLLSDHVERLVDALQEANANVACSTAFVGFVDEETPTAPFGTYLGTDRKPLERSRLLASDQIFGGALRVLMRRGILERAGWLNEAVTSGYEYELWLRLSSVDDVVSVDRITTIYSQLPGRSGVADFPSQRLIYALHPAQGRAAIEAERTSVLDHLARGEVPVFVPLRGLSPQFPA